MAHAALAVDCLAFVGPCLPYFVGTTYNYGLGGGAALIVGGGTANGTTISLTRVAALRNAVCKFGVLCFGTNGSSDGVGGGGGSKRTLLSAISSSRMHGSV